MKALTRLQIQGRAALHRRVGALPAWARRRLARLDGPARIDIALDDDGGPAGRPLGEWQDRVLDLFMAHGVLPVTVMARPGNPVLGDLVRFCHRLEAPVTVRIVGAGLDERVAAEIIDGGARRVIVEEPTPTALHALAAVRRSRSARVDVEAALPPEASVELARELMAAGADGVRVEPGWRAPVSRSWPLRDVIASFNRTDAAVWPALDRLAAVGADVAPGHPRDGGACGIGARVVLDREGIRSCPWKDSATDQKGTWADLEAHRAAIRACDRVCWHPEAR